MSAKKPVAGFDEFLAGVTIFVTILYIAFANPLILSPLGIPSGAVFFGTCAIAGLASIICGYWANAPTAIAPGMAFNLFIVSYAQLNHLSWQAVLLVCMMAGIAMSVMSAIGFRQKAIAAIPLPLQLAVIAGIGSILVDSALKMLQPMAGETSNAPRLMVFGIGVAIILLGYVVLREIAEKLKAHHPGLAGFLDIAGRMSFLLSVLASAQAARLFGLTAGYVITDVKPIFLFSEVSRANMLELFSPAAFSLFLFLIYMLIADIAGTPYQVLPDDAENRDKRIKRGFIVDSMANILAPMIGSSPPVYYAENNAAKVVGGTTGWVAIYVGAGFLALLVAGFIFSSSNIPFFELFPQVAIAPALFCVGVMIIAEAWGKGQKPKDAKPGSVWTLADSLPAAVTLTLTSPLGLEYGLAAGLFTYFAYYIFMPPAASAGTDRSPLSIVFMLAFVAIFFRLMVYVQANFAP